MVASSTRVRGLDKKAAQRADADLLLGASISVVLLVGVAVARAESVCLSVARCGEAVVVRGGSWQGANLWMERRRARVEC